jgi:Ca-activated chloride channel homolog
MQDAVYYVSRDILLKESAGTSRRIIVLVSDGEDNQSHVTQEEAIRMAQRARVTIYCISTNGRQDRGTWKLRDLSDATGGRTFLAGSPKEMSLALAQVSEELHAQYRVSYVPDDFSHDGKFRPIKIQLTDGKSKARPAKGYFAPAQ